MIKSLLFASDLQIITALSLGYAATGVVLYWVFYGPTWRLRIEAFEGVVAPFALQASSIFALTAGLLGFSVWGNFQANADSVGREAAAASAYIHLVDAVPTLREQGLLALAGNYLDLATGEEWAARMTRKQSPRAKQAFSVLLTRSVEIAARGDQPIAVSGLLARAIESWETARLSRLSFIGATAEETRWICVLLLGVFMQGGWLMVHIGKPKPAALSLTATTLVILVLLSLIALTVDPYKGLISISKAPLEAVLADLRTH